MAERLFIITGNMTLKNKISYSNKTTKKKNSIKKRC